MACEDGGPSPRAAACRYQSAAGRRHDACAREQRRGGDRAPALNGRHGDLPTSPYPIVGRRQARGGLRAWIQRPPRSAWCRPGVLGSTSTSYTRRSGTPRDQAPLVGLGEPRTRFPQRSHPRRIGGVSERHSTSESAASRVGAAQLSLVCGGCLKTVVMRRLFPYPWWVSCEPTRAHPRIYERRKCAHAESGRTRAKL